MFDENTSVELIERVCKGSGSAAWCEFLSIYSPFVDRQLRRMGLNELDASDVRQNVLTVLVKELPWFRHNGHPGAFRLWLRTVVRNQLRSFLRQASRVRERRVDFVKLESLADANSDLTAWWEREFALFTIEKALDILSTRFDRNTMIAFRRQVLDETRPGDVAVELNTSKQAVVAAKCRVLRALRQEVKRLDEIDRYAS